jgi:pSer/pThr/pTyr-binding forkhead associated (FHA) protein
MKLSQALTHLEKRLQTLVEDNLDGIFTTTDLQKTLGHELLLALQREARPSSDGRMLAPDQFTIYLPLEITQRLAAYRARLNELSHALAEAIEDFARQAGYVFADKLSIRILSEESGQASQQNRPVILATYKLLDTTKTATLGISAPPPTLEKTSDSKQTTRAFLIVNGVDIFALPGQGTGGVINIGRMAGNQLVLADHRVSRTHAQLRVMQGRYMLFDLASTHGTFVNGLRINSHELKAGDVISFGGVPVVFGLEENTNPQGYDLAGKRET